MCVCIHIYIYIYIYAKCWGLGSGGHSPSVEQGTSVARRLRRLKVKPLNLLLLSVAICCHMKGNLAPLRSAS